MVSLWPFHPLLSVSVLLLLVTSCKTKQQAVEVSRIESDAVITVGQSELNAVVTWFDVVQDSVDTNADSVPVKHYTVKRVGRAEIHGTRNESQQRHAVWQVDSSFSQQIGVNANIKSRLTEFVRSVLLFVVLLIVGCIAIRRL